MMRMKKKKRKEEEGDGSYTNIPTLFFSRKKSYL